MGVTSSPSSDFQVTVLLTGPEGFSPRTAAMSLGSTSTFTDLDPGTYTVSTTIFGFDCQSVSANVQADRTTTASIACTRRATALTGIVLGVVTAGDSPLGGASVELAAPGVTITRHTAANGNVTFVGVEPGEYTLTTFLQHFTCPIQTVVVDAQQTTRTNISCTAKTTGSLAGIVFHYDDTGWPVVEAIVNFNGPATGTAETQNGSFAFNDLQPGAYTVSASFPFMNCQAASADVQAARTTTVLISCVFRAPIGTELNGAWAYDRFRGSASGSCPVSLPELGTGSLTFNSSTHTIEILGLDPALTIIGTYDEGSGFYAGTGTAVLGDGSSLQTDVFLGFYLEVSDLYGTPVFYTDVTQSSGWTRRHRDPSGNVICTEVYGAGGYRVN